MGELCRSRALPVAVSGGAHDDGHPAVNAGSLDPRVAGCGRRHRRQSNGAKNTAVEREAVVTAAADSTPVAAATATRATGIAWPGLEDCRSTSLDRQRLRTDRNACTRGELRVQVHGRKPVKRSVGDAAAYAGSSPDRTVGAAHVSRLTN